MRTHKKTLNLECRKKGLSQPTQLPAHHEAIPSFLALTPIAKQHPFPSPAHQVQLYLPHRAHFPPSSFHPAPTILTASEVLFSHASILQSPQFASPSPPPDTPTILQHLLLHFPDIWHLSKPHSCPILTATDQLELTHNPAHTCPTLLPFTPIDA